MPSEMSDLFGAVKSFKNMGYIHFANALTGSLITIEEIQYENQKAREEYLHYIDKMEQKIADYYERKCPYTIEVCSDF